MTAIDSVIEKLRTIVGDGGLIVDPTQMQPYLQSWRDNWIGKSPAVVRPASTGQVAAVVKLCADTGTRIVPQGGRTGVTGASQPHGDSSEIVLSLERMNRIRSLDLDNDTLTAEAGCILEEVRAAAQNAGRLFPLSFGSVGSCQIGGNISTNAGGVNVIRYGSTRNLITGLEVVLPDGRIWDGLRSLRKDNAGYDMKQIFIGAEGTLGIVTAAVVRLFPYPRGSAMAVLAVSSPAHALGWLRRLKARFAEELTSFELIQRLCIEVTRKHIPGIPEILAEVAPWYVLVEVSGQDDDFSLKSALEQELEAGFSAGEAVNATIAESRQQEQSMWRLRESIPEAHKSEGASFKHDISVPITMIPEFLTRVESELARAIPNLRMFTFGHVGDGNLHFNPLMPAGVEPGRGDLQRVNTIVHDIVASLGGSISAEHGIGRLRREELVKYKSAVELDMMLTLKRAFDPMNLLNPGKIFTDELVRNSGRS
jgi:FAD/FMN-containing dehydrogenase